MTRTLTIIAALSFLFVAEAAAQGRGRGPGRGHGPGWGQGRGMGRGGMGGMGLRMGCARMLMRAHPDMLKTKLGITDAQVTKIQAVRNNVISKRINSKAQLAQIRLKLRTLGEQDLPDEKKVLNLMRKARGVRGRMTEEGVKAHLKVLRMLKKEQRAMLRATCSQQARWGQRGNRRWGKGGRGYGRHGGGRGGRGHGGPGGPGGPGGW